MITTLLQAYKSKCVKQKQVIDALRVQNEAYRQYAACLTGVAPHANHVPISRELEQRDVPNINNKRMRYESVEQFTVRSSDPATVSMTTPSRAAPNPPQHHRPATTMPKAGTRLHSIDPSSPPAATKIPPPPRAMSTMPSGQGPGRSFGHSKQQQKSVPQPPPRPESRFEYVPSFMPRCLSTHVLGLQSVCVQSSRRARAAYSHHANACPPDFRRVWGSQSDYFSTCSLTTSSIEGDASTSTTECRTNRREVQTCCAGADDGNHRRTSSVRRG